MSDLPPLGVPRRPGSAPRSDVLDCVVRQGRQRLRRAGVSAMAALALIVAGVASGSLFGSDGGGSLVFVPATPDADDPAASLSAETLPPLVSASASPRIAAHAMSPEMDRPVVGESQPGRAATRTSPPMPRPRAGARPYRENPGTTTDSTNCDVANVIAGTPPGTRVCAMASANRTTVKSGETVEVELLLCNTLSSDRIYRVEFSTGREHELRAESGDDALWTWSRAYLFPEGAHGRDITPGYCLQWMTNWDTRDDDGRLVEPGVYFLNARIEVSGDPRAFEIRVDVTG